MADKMDEMILAVDTEVLRKSGYFQGLDFDKCENLLMTLSKENCRFVRRGDAETNEDLKQLIPYVIVTHGGKILCYVRGKKSGETRLASKASIGIGGHINDSDGSLSSNEDISKAYKIAMEREINEELNIPGGYTYSTVAILNDDSNSVGRVHLGMVHMVVTNDDNVTFAEPDVIMDVSWKTLPELKAMTNLENWSSICVEVIEAIMLHPNTGLMSGEKLCKNQ
jgi:predicted NUDIX family phosphoesterase